MERFQLTQEEVNDYLSGLLKNQGAQLEGLEGQVLANFRQANGELAQLSQALQNAKTEHERISSMIQRTQSDIQKAAGTVEAFARILTEAETARRAEPVEETLPVVEKSAPAEVPLPEPTPAEAFEESVVKS